MRERIWVAATLLVACSAANDGGGIASGGSGNLAGSGGSGTGGAASDAQPWGNTGGSSAGVGGSAGQAGSATDAGGDADAALAVTSCTAAGGLDCSASTAQSYACGDPNPSFDAAVDAAIGQVLAQHPEWFDFAQGPAPCCPLALEPKSFVEAVVAAVDAGGLCATIDPNNPAIEIVVKHDNACSEQYVLLTSANIVRKPAKFQGSCLPAWL